MTKKQFVRSEREFTVELLKKLTKKEWQARTLCSDWTVEDLAAHLVSRERNAIGGIGLVVPGLHFLHERRIERIKRKGHAYIIKKLSKYPWWMAASLNTAEFWVHNEDMLRGELNMKRPTPEGDRGEILWQALKGLIRVKKNMVADLGSLQIENTQATAVITIPNHHSLKDTIITGPPGELLLYFYGRRTKAKVDVNTVKL